MKIINKQFLDFFKTSKKPLLIFVGCSHLRGPDTNKKIGIDETAYKKSFPYYLAQKFPDYNFIVYAFNGYGNSTLGNFVNILSYMNVVGNIFLFPTNLFRTNIDLISAELTDKIRPIEGSIKFPIDVILQRFFGNICHEYDNITFFDSRNHREFECGPPVLILKTVNDGSGDTTGRSSKLDGHIWIDKKIKGIDTDNLAKAIQLTKSNKTNHLDEMTFWVQLKNWYKHFSHFRVISWPPEPEWLYGVNIEKFMIGGLLDKINKTLLHRYHKEGKSLDTFKSKLGVSLFPWHGHHGHFEPEAQQLIADTIEPLLFSSDYRKVIKQNKKDKFKFDPNIMGKTFCIAPFTHTVIDTEGKYSVCCNSNSVFPEYNHRTHSMSDVFYSPEYSKIRNQMINGAKPVICNVCWEKEELGLESSRQRYNDKYKDLISTELIHTQVLKWIDIKFDNKCNFGCRICHPSDSSLVWQSAYELRNNKHIPRNYKLKEDPTMLSDNHELFVDKVSGVIANKKSLLPELKKIASTLVIMKFTGGEPTINEDFKMFIDFCIENNYTNKRLFITTNGSTFNDGILEKLMKFTWLDITMSMDGFNDSYSYMRWPYKWESIVKRLNYLMESVLTHKDNVIKFKNKNGILNPHLSKIRFNANINTVVNALNIFCLPKLWWHNLNLARKIFKTKLGDSPFNEQKMFEIIFLLMSTSFQIKLRPENSEYNIKVLSDELLLEAREEYVKIREFEMEEVGWSKSKANDVITIIDKTIGTIRQYEDINCFKESVITLDNLRKQNYRKFLDIRIANYIDSINDDMITNINKIVAIKKVKLQKENYVVD
ncbi:MAG: hypothetical protein CXT73_01760 [Methanobacteriota archaeon]|jgi:organic radical activating enzyme|nr:MAG: hypothetical protein CXT73_01760 [Euryarchaeota archaeon]